jgi:hypothetical protein
MSTTRSTYKTKDQIEGPTYDDSGALVQKAISLGSTAMPWYMKIQDRMLKNSEVFENPQFTFSDVVEGINDGKPVTQKMFSPTKKMNLGRWSRGVEINQSYFDHMLSEAKIGDAGSEFKNKIHFKRDFYNDIKNKLSENNFSDRDIKNILGDEGNFDYSKLIEEDGSFVAKAVETVDASKLVYDGGEKINLEDYLGDAPKGPGMPAITEATDAEKWEILKDNEIWDLGGGDYEKGKRLWEDKYGFGGRGKGFETHLNSEYDKVISQLNLSDGDNKYLYSLEHTGGENKPWNKNYTKSPQTIDTNSRWSGGLDPEGNFVAWDKNKVVNIPGITEEQSQLIQSAELRKAKTKYEDLKRSSGNRNWKFDRDATTIDKKLALGGDLEVVRKDISGPKLGQIDYDYASKTSTLSTGIKYDPKLKTFVKKDKKLPTKLNDLPTYNYTDSRTGDVTKYEAPSFKMTKDKKDGFFRNIGKGSVKEAWQTSTPGKVTKAITHIGRGGVKEAWAGSSGQAVVEAFKGIGKGGFKKLAANTFGQTAATTGASAGATAGAAAGAGNAGLFASMGPAGWTMLALSLVGGKLFKPHTVLGKIFSDKRLKNNIKKVGKSPSGINIYEFGYNDVKGRYRGVISQDVPSHAVEKDFSGYDMVDYNKIDVDFMKVK